MKGTTNAEHRSRAEDAVGVRPACAAAYAMPARVEPGSSGIAVRALSAEAQPDQRGAVELGEYPLRLEPGRTMFYEDVAVGLHPGIVLEQAGG